MNIGYEDDELKPHIEPPVDYSDQTRIGMSVFPLVIVHDDM